MAVLKTALLFVTTALAEIVGCFLPYLWLRKRWRETVGFDWIGAGVALCGMGIIVLGWGRYG